jgi:hypothetical protein
MNIRARTWLIVPVVLAVCGWGWMQAAVSHYEVKTGRQFYGLSGYHYSSPEWGFAYHPGGEDIHRWTTKLPTAATLILMALSLIGTVIVTRNSGWLQISGVVAVHVLVAMIFMLIVAWYDINITGVFI